MIEAKRRALAIMREFELAEDELIGKCAVLSDGKADTIARVILDELHGLRLEILGHDGAWPVATIKFLQR